MNLMDKLRFYGLEHPDEETMVRRFIDLLDGGPACLVRHNLPGHLTGSAWVVNMDCTKTLLVHHRKLGKWIQPGGHADGECDLISVAGRELREEAGLMKVRLCGDEIFDLDIHSIPPTEDFPEHFHFDVRFLFIARESDRLRVSDESYELRWVNMDRLEELTQEGSVLRMRLKCRNTGFGAYGEKLKT